MYDEGSIIFNFLCCSPFQAPCSQPCGTWNGLSEAQQCKFNDEGTTHIAVSHQTLRSQKSLFFLI